MKLIALTIIIFLNNFLYIYCAKPCPTIRIQNGSVKLRAKGRLARFRCNRGYTLNGENTVACINGEWDTDIPKCVFRSRCTPITQIRNGHVIANKQWTALRFICNSGYHLIGKTQLLCKDSRWDGEPPQCQTSVQLSCDFERKGICGWDNSTKSGFFWLKRQYATPSHYLNTGPGHDHTLHPKNNGHYLYIETSGLYGKDLKTNIARLYSPLFPPVESNGTCFTFWYHMFGTTIGELNVYIDGHKVFHKAGNQGNRWIKGKIPNLPMDTFFQISIEGVPGNGWTGDIAIDDLNVTTSEECTRPEIEDTTCDGRCYEDEAQNSTLCGCNDKCISTSTCCTDFFDVCNAETTTLGISSNAFTNEDESTTREEKFDSSTTEELITGFEVTSKKKITNYNMNVTNAYKTDLTTQNSYSLPYTFETSTIGQINFTVPETSQINFISITAGSHYPKEVSTEMSDEIIITSDSSINLTSLVFHTHLHNNENITVQTELYLIPFLNDSFEQANNTIVVSAIEHNVEEAHTMTENALKQAKNATVINAITNKFEQPYTSTENALEQANNVTVISAIEHNYEQARTTTENAFEQANNTTIISAITHKFKQAYTTKENVFKQTNNTTIINTNFEQAYTTTENAFEQANTVTEINSVAHNSEAATEISERESIIAHNFDDFQTFTERTDKQTLSGITITNNFKHLQTITERSNFNGIQNRTESTVTETFKQAQTPTEYSNISNFTEKLSTIESTNISNFKEAHTIEITDIKDDTGTTEDFKQVQTSSGTNIFKKSYITTENIKTNNFKEVLLNTTTSQNTRKFDSSINLLTNNSNLLTTQYKESTTILLTIKLLEPEAKTERTKWKSIYKPKGYFKYSAIKQEQKGNGMKNIAIIIGIAIIFTAIISTGIYLYRRRSFLNTSNNVEEADVLFIPTDEILDFSLSRPHSVNNRKIDVNKV